MIQNKCQEASCFSLKIRTFLLNIWSVNLQVLYFKEFHTEKYMPGTDVSSNFRHIHAHKQEALLSHPNSENWANNS